MYTRYIETQKWFPLQRPLSPADVHLTRILRPIRAHNLFGISIDSVTSTRFTSVTDRQTDIPTPAFTLITSGQSNFTLGRIAVAHGRFSRIRQMAPMCTPFIECQKCLPRQRASTLLNRNLTHYSNIPSEPTTQTESRLVQPFCRAH